MLRDETLLRSSLTASIPHIIPYKERPIVKQEVSTDDKKNQEMTRLNHALDLKMLTPHYMSCSRDCRCVGFSAIRQVIWFAVALVFQITFNRGNLVAYACDSDKVEVQIVLSQFGATVWIDGEQRGKAPLKSLCL